MTPGLLATEADRAALAEVLARPEFRGRRLDGSALRQLLSDLWDRLLEAMGTAEAERYASLGRAVFLLAVAVAAALAWRAARRRPRGPARAVAHPTDHASPARAPPPAHLEAAASALRRGEHVEAVRRAYAATAAALGGRGLASGGEALTGLELAALAGDAGFEALARLHDRAVFGRLPVSGPEARRAVEVAHRLSGAGEVAR